MNGVQISESQSFIAQYQKQNMACIDGGTTKTAHHDKLLIHPWTLLPDPMEIQCGIL
jgi:hypothetical protein